LPEVSSKAQHWSFEASELTPKKPKLIPSVELNPRSQCSATRSQEHSILLVSKSAHLTPPTHI